MRRRRPSGVIYDPIDFRVLRYFIAVQTTGSFSRAAEQVGVSQPNISTQISRLEKSLNVKLLQRGGPRVMLSPFGQIFCRYALGIMRLTEDLRTRLATPPETISGNLRIGVIPPLNFAALPTLLGAFTKSHPAATFGVEEITSASIETALEDGRIDVGLGFLSPHSSRFHHQSLGKDRFVWIVHRSHPGAEKRSVHLSELEGERIVAMPERFLLRRVTDDVLREQGIRPSVVAEIGALGMLLRALGPLKAGTILPRIALHEGGDLVAIPLKGKKLSLRLGLLTLAGSQTQGLIQEFARLAREIIPPLVGTTRSLD